MKPPTLSRNPGPNWGYRLINRIDSWLPDRSMRCLLRIGSFISLWLMTTQRRHSQRFLRDALGRQPTWKDSWDHFYAFSEFLVTRFRVANGFQPVFQQSETNDNRMEALASRKEQALYGTFHYGNSDLMGFWLSVFDLSVRMVRYRVENSDDLDWLSQRFGDTVQFIWVNNPENLLFTLKNAIEEGHSIAMKCDRAEHSSKLEPFTFLGHRRLFPFTIYHLSILFNLPVVFSIGFPEKNGTTTVYSTTIYNPIESSKSQNLARARNHFREALTLLESVIHRSPFHWFNFLDALPLVSDTRET